MTNAFQMLPRAEVTVFQKSALLHVGLTLVPSLLSGPPSLPFRMRMAHPAVSLDIGSLSYFLILLKLMAEIDLSFAEIVETTGIPEAE